MNKMIKGLIGLATCTAVVASLVSTLNLGHAWFFGLLALGLVTHITTGYDSNKIKDKYKTLVTYGLNSIDAVVLGVFISLLDFSNTQIFVGALLSLLLFSSTLLVVNNFDLNYSSMKPYLHKACNLLIVALIVSLIGIALLSPNFVWLFYGSVAVSLVTSLGNLCVYLDELKHGESKDGFDLYSTYMNVRHVFTSILILSDTE